MRLFISICYILLFLSFIGTISVPEEQLTIPELVQLNGYTLQRYLAKTDDGYFLTIHRLAKNNVQIKSGKPVILLHGLLGSSDDWFMNRNSSLPYYLYEQGYDVWLPNLRGNKYSLEHSAYVHSQDNEFWKFSFDQISRFDIQTIIDFPIQERQFSSSPVSSVDIIAYGEAAIPLLMAIADRGSQLDVSIDHLLFLAPVLFFDKSNPPVFLSSLNSNSIIFQNAQAQDIYQVFQGGLLSQNMKVICLQISKLCQDPYLVYGLSINDILLLNSQNQAFKNNFPSGTSIRVLNHLYQIYKQNNGICMYDYGVFENQQIYGEIQPPCYQLSQIINFERIAILMGGDDTIATESTITQLENAMEYSHSIYYFNSVNNLDHAGFLLGDWRNSHGWNGLFDKISYILETPTGFLQ